MQNRKISTFWGISIIIIESVIVFFIFYILYFFWIENPTPTDNILIVRALSNRGLVIPANVNTADWLTYNNEDYNFSFKYPASYDLTNDEIAYGENEGELINLNDTDTTDFYVRVFPIQPEETISSAYLRLTGVNPEAYQFFTEKISGAEAVVYRKLPGDPIGDEIYFISGQYLYEAPFNKNSVNFLSTFKFLP